MGPMYLKSVEQNPDAKGRRAEIALLLRSRGMPVPQIFHLLAYKPAATRHLDRFTQAVMRGPSPLSAGQRELIAAFTSARNHCVF